MAESPFRTAENLDVTPMWRRKSRALEGLKTGLLGAVCGAVLTVVVGFAIGGWTTSDVADQRASREADLSVRDLMVDICVAQSERDSNRAQILADLKDVKIYARPAIVLKVGWAAMPGASGSNRDVAVLCADRINAKIEDCTQAKQRALKEFMAEAKSCLRGSACDYDSRTQQRRLLLQRFDCWSADFDPWLAPQFDLNRQ